MSKLLKEFISSANGVSHPLTPLKWLNVTAVLGEHKQSVTTNQAEAAITNQDTITVQKHVIKTKVAPNTHLAWLDSAVSSESCFRVRLMFLGLGRGLGLGACPFLHQIAKLPISLKKTRAH